MNKLRIFGHKRGENALRKFIQEFPEFNTNKKMNASRLLPMMIYLWILAAFIINYSLEAKKIRRKNHHHHQKCMTYKNPAYSSEMSQNEHKRMKRVNL